MIVLGGEISSNYKENHINILFIDKKLEMIERYAEGLAKTFHFFYFF
jgi:hypothetical protein